MADLARLLFASSLRTPAHPLKAIGSFERDDLRLGAQLNRRALLDSPNEITRHRLRQPLRADEDVHAVRVLREKDRGLSRRITAANDDDFFATTQLRFD